MSTKMQFSVTEENRDWPKQIGCMNGIFQLFDRHNYLAGWRTSSHNNKRLLLGTQNQSHPQNATKPVLERALDVQKEKLGAFGDSSLDCNNMVQRETLALTKIRVQITAKKSHRSSLDKDLRDVVKESMDRELQRRGCTIKHIDSPRPMQPSKSEIQELTAYDLSRTQSKDEQLTLPRFSYDEKVSRERLKSNVKLKESPRLSLDSSIKGSFLESRSEYLGHESHNRSSGVVAKLMGLEDFPDIGDRISKSEEALLRRSSTAAEKSKQNSPRALLNYSASSSPRLHSASSVKQPAARRHLESTQSYQRISPASSVYAGIQKRITEVEFKRPSNDLRVLKKILESMLKTEDEAESLENSISDQNSCRKMQSLIGGGAPKQLTSSIAKTRPTKVNNRIKMPQSSEITSVEVRRLQRIQQNHNPSTNTAVQRKNNLKHSSSDLPSIWGKARCKTSERCIKEESFSTSPRSMEARSPRFRQYSATNSGRARNHSSKKVVQKTSQNKNQVKKKRFELCDDHLSEISSEAILSSASLKSESNTSFSSQMETEIMCFGHPISTNTRHHKNSVSTLNDCTPVSEHELVGVMQEQPSPVSVLDAAFYCEGSPSPVKRISTAFGDERSSHDEAQWHFENPIHLADYPESDHDYCHQTTKSMRHVVSELMVLNREPHERGANQNETGYDGLSSDHRYVNKILQATGLLKGTLYIAEANQLLYSGHMINPDLFNLLEQIEVTQERETGGLIAKSDQKFNKKIDRKIVFDIVNEVLVGRLLAWRRKSNNPEVLVKDVCVEVERLCRMADNNRNEEDDGLTKLFAADMKYPSDDWIQYSADIPALVLDIERLIFKDLVNEVATCELMNIHARPTKGCRLLFTP